MVMQLWSQLSLKASPITLHPSTRRSDGILGLAFALAHMDVLQPSLTLLQTRARWGNLANIHDVKPPAGVYTGSLDSIQLALHFSPLTSLRHSSLAPRIATSHYHKPQTDTELVPSLLTATQTDIATNVSSNLNPISEEEMTDVDNPFWSSRTDGFSWDIEMLDHGAEGPDMLPLPDTLSQPYPPNCTPPFMDHEIQTQEPPSSSQHTPNPLDLLRLLDTSLRHTLTGRIPVGRRPRRPNSDPLDIQLVHGTAGPSLADISPALFRPGYLKVNASLTCRVMGN